MASARYAESVEARYIYAVAPLNLNEKTKGITLQREAFLHSDLLPIYGSSELNIPDRFHASKIFRTFPTGFDVFTIGDNDAEPLTMMQRLAGSGAEMSGKQVVISLSPQFFLQDGYLPAAYRANFSRPQAYELVFSNQLSYKLKQMVARRMLQYPETLTDDSLLQFTLKVLADGSPSSTLVYYAVFPLGRISALVFELQDYASTTYALSTVYKLNSDVPPRGGGVGWETLLAHAKASYEPQANNNPYGFSNDQWDQFGDQWGNPKSKVSEAVFLHYLNQPRPWNDLNLLLQELKELNARPFVISVPLSGSYLDWQGVSSSARHMYYQRLCKAVEAFGMPVMPFENHDSDKYFLWSPGGHLSSEGWVFFSQALDQFRNGVVARGCS